ncbi:C-C motif chemokine 28 [Morphnus guianensis]
MDVNLVTVLALLAVAVSQTSETLFPGAFNCCTKLSDEIPKGILRRVERFEIQKAAGLCHLEAIMCVRTMIILKSWGGYIFSLKLTTNFCSGSLYIEGRKFCVSPRIRKVKKWMKKNKHKIPRKKSHGKKQRRIKIIKKKQ